MRINLESVKKPGVSTIHARHHGRSLSRHRERRLTVTDAPGRPASLEVDVEQTEFVPDIRELTPSIRYAVTGASLAGGALTAGALMGGGGGPVGIAIGVEVAMAVIKGTFLESVTVGVREVSSKVKQKVMECEREFRRCIESVATRSSMLH